MLCLDSLEGQDDERRRAGQWVGEAGSPCEGDRWREFATLDLVALGVPSLAGVAIVDFFRERNLELVRLF